MAVTINGTTGITAPLILGQIVTTALNTVATGTTPIPFDNTIPQITEGDQYLSRTITPKNASSLLEIDVTLVISVATANQQITVALFNDTSTNALAVSEAFMATLGGIVTLSFKHIMTAGTTNTMTFTVRAGGLSGTTSVNGSSGAQHFGGTYASRITIKEYLP